MLSRRDINSIFVLEGLNSFATTLYFYYVYFFTEQTFGFTKMENLLLAAAQGLTYGVASMVGGRFGQRRGCLTALQVGFAILALMIGSAVFARTLPVHLVILLVGTFGMAFTWPALEALVSEGQSRRGLQRNLGLYNLVWGGLGAVAYFLGGAIIKAGTFRALFAVAAAIHVVQLLWVLALAHRARSASAGPVRATNDPDAVEHEQERHRSPISPKTFLNMAWLANPFAYLAINTVVAVIPAVAGKLQLSVVQAGIFCSVWLFVRTGSFLLLWLWPGWHYRFRWLNAAYLVMTASFATMLVAANLWVVLAAQVAFGLALGLIYYSSLYYSMDVGDTKGEHGGFHEAMIGAGSCAGPAIGAAGAYFFPHAPNASTWTPAGLLVVGFAGLLWLRFCGKAAKPHAAT